MDDDAKIKFNELTHIIALRMGYDLDEFSGPNEALLRKLQGTITPQNVGALAAATAYIVDSEDTKTSGPESQDTADKEADDGDTKTYENSSSENILLLAHCMSMKLTERAICQWNNDEMLSQVLAAASNMSSFACEQKQTLVGTWMEAAFNVALDRKLPSFHQNLVEVAPHFIESALLNGNVAKSIDIIIKTEDLAEFEPEDDSEPLLGRAGWRSAVDNMINTTFQRASKMKTTEELTKLIELLEEKALDENRSPWLRNSLLEMGVVLTCKRQQLSQRFGDPSDASVTNNFSIMPDAWTEWFLTDLQISENTITQRHERAGDLEETLVGLGLEVPKMLVQKKQQWIQEEEEILSKQETGPISDELGKAFVGLLKRSKKEFETAVQAIVQGSQKLKKRLGVQKTMPQRAKESIRIPEEQPPSASSGRL